MSSPYDLITDYSSFEPKKVVFGNVKTNSRGGKSIKIMDSGNNTLIISTPMMLTWGINRMDDPDTGRVSYSVSLQFPGEGYSTDAADSFLQKMKDFENHILDSIVENSQKWMGKSKLSREVAEALYTPILKYPKDKSSGDPDHSRSPSMRLKISAWEGKFNVELYNTDSQPIFVPTMDLGSTPFESLIPKGSHMIAAMQCNGIWFAAGKFGVTWQLSQAMIRKPVRLQGGCFLRMSEHDRRVAGDADERERRALESGMQSTGADGGAQTTGVDDTDDEDGGEDEGGTVTGGRDGGDDDDEDDEEDAAVAAVAAQEPEPVMSPPPIVKKKRRVVKKT